MIFDWIEKGKNKLFKKRKKILIKINDLNLKKQKKIVLSNPNLLIENQIKHPNTIPIIIINFNQLYYLKKLITFLKERNTQNIVIIDNKSTYLPLLHYYDQIKNDGDIEIIIQNKNLGHLAFWKNRTLFNQYAQGFFVITDADIVPNNQLQENYLKPMLDLLFKYNHKTKIGFALDIENLPDHYSQKEKVINWERKFWDKEIETNVYDADIDTTFALYWPKTDRLTKYVYESFFNGIRLGGDYTAQHGGWYLNHKELTDEEAYYLKTANNSNSWKIDHKGVLKGDFTNDY